MLKLETARVAAVLAAQSPEDLYEHLQGAIQLEHSTIPVYLCAYFSIKRGYMPEIRQTLESIFREEMLHMGIVCNVLNAIGGKPQIDHAEFVPHYPGPLPMNINSSLTVHLGPLSLERVRNEFMEIEEPETRLDFPVHALTAAVGAPAFATIGQFYVALMERIKAFGDEIFTGDPGRQVVNEQWFDADQLFAIRDVETATRALEIITQQGEGTRTSPLDLEGGLAHFYQFQEIFKGKRLVRNSSVPQGFSFDPTKPVPFDPAGIWDMQMDPKAAQYRPGSRARLLADEFNWTYTRLLKALGQTFDQTPEALNAAMGLMFELKLAADALIEVVDEDTGKHATPSFEYVAAPPA